MKPKFYLVIMLAVGCMLSSCNEDLDSFRNTKELAGIWCMPYDDGTVEFYVELTESKFSLYYDDNYYDTNDYATYKDGYIVNGSDTEWEKMISVLYEFDEKDQCLYYNGIEAATLQRIGKDEAIMKSDLLADFLGISNMHIYRVKGIK